MVGPSESKRAGPLNLTPRNKAYYLLVYLLEDREQPGVGGTTMEHTSSIGQVPLAYLPPLTYSLG